MLSSFQLVSLCCPHLYSDRPVDLQVSVFSVSAFFSFCSKVSLVRLRVTFLKSAFCHSFSAAFFLCLCFICCQLLQSVFQRGFIGQSAELFQACHSVRLLFYSDQPVDLQVSVFSVSAFSASARYQSRLRVTFAKSAFCVIQQRRVFSSDALSAVSCAICFQRRFICRRGGELFQLVILYGCVFILTSQLICKFLFFSVSGVFSFCSVSVRLRVTFAKSAFLSFGSAAFSLPALYLLSVIAICFSSAALSAVLSAELFSACHSVLPHLY